MQNEIIVEQYFFFFLILQLLYLFIYLFLAVLGLRFVRGLSLVTASGGHSSSRCRDRSSSRCAGLSLSQPPPLRGTGSRRAGSAVVAHGPSCSAARGIFPDQGTNPCPLHQQADSQPLRHQGSPSSNIFICCYQPACEATLIIKAVKKSTSLNEKHSSSNKDPTVIQDTYSHLPLLPCQLGSTDLQYLPSPREAGAGMGYDQFIGN